jgi:hypothetical protein
MIDRYRALVALRERDFPGRANFLVRAWQAASFHLDRGEVAGQMTESGDTFFDEIIIRALEDPDPLVRRAVIERADKVPARLQEEYEKRLHDFSYVNTEKALDLLARSFPENIPAYLDETREETGWRGRNIRIKWLEIAIGAGNSELIRELTGYCSPHYEFETRINAFNLLKRLNYLDAVTAGYLVDGYSYWNYKVSNAAKEVLLYFYQQNRGKALIEQAIEQSGADPLKMSQLAGYLQSFNP